MSQGRFITFEGGDGAGKTTLIDKVADLLTTQGHQVVITREPGGTTLGEDIRKILLSHETGEINPTAELLLFLTSRSQHIHEKILPALHQGKIVLCDRFNDSSVVYQGVGRALGLHHVQEICNLACGEIKPELTIYLDLSPDESQKRKQGEDDRIESEGQEFHQKIREGYLELMEEEPLRIHKIDATQSIESVYNQARVMVEALLSE